VTVQIESCDCLDPDSECAETGHQHHHA